jgi:endoglucanase
MLQPSAVFFMLLSVVGCGAAGGGAKSGGADGFDECPAGLIEDFEDGDHQLLQQDGRGGFWYIEADEEGTTIEPDGEFEPSDGGAHGTHKAGHIVGRTAAGSNVWAGMSVNLANPKQPYDASKYRGISFYARRGKAGTPHVIVRVPDAGSDPEGGVCKDCWNDFGASLELSEHFRKFVLPFDELRQEPGWGEQRAEIDAKKLFGLKWQIKAPSTNYDIWLDDIRFVGCK